MQTRLIVALDVPKSAALRQLLTRLPAEIQWVKAGLELFCAEGPNALAPLKDADKNIFLDLKLHDIPRTVERAVASAATHGVKMLTIHASGGREMCKAAANAAGESGITLLAVTVLTSLDQSDFSDLGIARSTSDQALALAEISLGAGVPGLVCSPHEVSNLRARFGKSPVLVVPGIRPAHSSAGDQKRIGTPEDAARAGASFIVVGRPILDAADPRAAAQGVLDALASAG